jgi:plasmid stabilization system protein ParE
LGLELKIVYSKIANHDLKEIYSFISHDSIKYAKREVALIQTAIKKLKKGPFIGK